MYPLYSVMQDSFIVPDIFCALSIHSSFHHNPWKPLIFFIVSIILAFQESCIVGIIQHTALSDWPLSLQFCCSVMSDSLQPHGLQHAKLPCLSPTPGACSTSCPLSRWCHPTISSSVVPFSFCLQSFPTSGSFQMRCLLLGRKVMTNLDSILKSTAITLPTKVHLVKAMVFPVVMYGCESWTIRKAECWRIDATGVLEKTLESPLDCKEIQPVHPKGDQPWIFIGRTDIEAETPILWPPDVKSWLIWRRLKTSATLP